MKTNNNKGFTLLEVLLAVAIFAVVSSMVGYAVRTAVVTLELTRHRKDIYRQARVALDRIRADLTGVQAGTAFIGESKELEGKSADRLRFFSSAHVDFSSSQPSQAIAEIRYEVEPDEEDQAVRKLIRYDTLALPGAGSVEEEGTGFVLCEDLAAVSFSFAGGDGRKNDTWEAEPVEQEAEAEPPLPLVVYVSLEFLSDDSRQSTMRFDTAVWLPSAVGSGAGQ